ncbi:MAG: type II secretion system protein [Pseudomonadota bacterium]
MSRVRGFTLIEVITTMIVLSILAVGITSFLGRTVGGYVDSADRSRMAAALVVAAEKIARDLRHALPNSIRIGGPSDNCVEFVPVLQGGFYTGIPTGTAAGTMTAMSPGNPSPIVGRIAVYPVSTSDIYSPTDAAPSPVTNAVASVPTGTGEITITLGATHQFDNESPGTRFYVIDEPVTYCQPAGSDRIYRYRNYGFNATAVLPPSGATVEVLITEADTASLLDFEYTDASLTRNAIVSFRLQARVDQETMPLNQEVRIRNVP